MMRDIIFRGKIVNTDKWCYGYFSNGPENTFVISARKCYAINYAVDPETIGQYIGISDVNGRQIFEGDIVQYADSGYLKKTAPKYVVRYGLHKIKCCGCCYEYHQTVGFYLQSVDSTNEDIYAGEDEFEDLVVIGNVYDNPEMLKRRK